MIRSVDFISRREAEALPPSDLYIISIWEPESGPANLHQAEERILRLEFHDIDEPGPDGYLLFNEGHAQLIVEWVRNLHGNNMEVKVLVHCRAGISRSAAVALYIERETGCLFSRKHASDLHNRHILATLERVAGWRLKFEEAMEVWRNSNDG